MMLERYGRFKAADGNVFFAAIGAGGVQPLDAAPWLHGRATGEVRAAKDLKQPCPIAPTKIVCVGWNYAAHTREAGGTLPAEPLFFLKPPSALVGPGDAVVLPPESDRVEHEAELGVVIGSRARQVSRERALGHVFGYTCVADVTARDILRKNGQMTRAKGYDTFCPAGPEIVTQVDPSKLRITCRVSNVVRQDAVTADMIFD